MTVCTHGDFISVSPLALQEQAPKPRPNFPLKSHYPDVELISPCPILVVPNTRLSSNKYQFRKPLV